jgi:hypothetical protein
MCADMSDDAPEFKKEIKNRELYSLSLTIDEVDKKVDTLFENFDRVIKSYALLEKKNRVVAESVGNIRLVGEELSKIHSGEDSPQVIINSVEFATLIDYLKPMIENSVSRNIEHLIGSESNELKDALKIFTEQQRDTISHLKEIEQENVELKKELVVKSQELVSTRDSIFYLTKYMQEFAFEIKKIYPKFNMDYELEIKYVGDDKSEKTEETKEPEMKIEAKKKPQNNFKRKTEMPRKKKVGFFASFFKKSV